MSDVQATSPSHPFELLFAQLTGAMSKAAGTPIVHVLGPEPNGVAGQPERIVWTVTGFGDLAKRGYRRQGHAFVGFLPVVLEVELYGGSPLEVLDRVTQLVGWIDILVGPAQGAPGAGDGYKVGKSSAFEVGDGPTTGAGCRLSVTLYMLVFQMVLGSRTVAAVVVNTTALNPDGAVPTGDPLNPLQASA